ncbi:hypothetical protein GCM10008967_02880 [Bacillus carboniphilus]|uniref:NERD domain-containing protein n=1 Tax=Bacillus carboniphilus TaxID=86663 RepID=A0ABN0VRU1_9BACI
MFILPREKPIQMSIIEALTRRLPKNHPLHPSLQKEYNQRKKGLVGEENVDYYLSYLPESQFHIFRGIRLIVDHKPFQIDTLLISRNLILLIEVKNRKGSLYFDDVYNQLIWSDEEKREVLEDPLQQVKRQSRQLIKWLQEKRQPNIPIEYLVVMGDSGTFIDPKSGPLYQKYILHAYSLEEKIDEIMQHYKKPLISNDALHRLSTKLLKHHNPLIIDPQKTYKYDPKDLIKGIQCEKCKRFGMGRTNRKWTCPFCGATSFDAHKAAIQDYFLLIKREISNKECRDFLKISSIKTAYTILNSMKLSYKGKYKNRIYFNQLRTGK